MLSPSDLAAFVTSDPLLTRMSAAFAYVTLGASGIVTEELAPILGGFAAEQGHLGFKRVVAALTIGTWISSGLLYWLGWWKAAWVRLRLRKVSPKIRRVLVGLKSRPWSSAIAARFAFGGRIAIPLACGAARVRLVPFFVGTAIASFAWSLLFASVGWFFGESAVLLLGEIRKYEDWFVVGIVVVAALVFLWMRRRTRRQIAADLGDDPAASTLSEEKDGV